VVDPVGAALVDEGADPLASTFWSQSVFNPYTRAITNPSSVATAPTGVAYGVPEVRPVCRITDA
jgi:hypothetical protein